MTFKQRLIGVITAGFVAGGCLSAPAMGQSEDVISDSAAVYATFQADVTDVREQPLSSAGDIESTLTELGGQNPQQLSNGFIAYSALIASQDPQFRAAVRDIESFYGRDTLMLGLRNDVRYARTLDGGTSAVASSLGAISADARRIEGAGAYVKEQAYSLQGAGWANARIGDTDPLIARVRNLSLTGRPVNANLRAAFSSPDIDGVLVQAGRQGAPSLWENVNTAASAVRFPAINAVYSGRSARIRSGHEATADQIATLAAYRVLGTTGTAPGEVRGAMNATATRNCINMAQLNLHQCVAAAHQQFEVPFCIGEHALTDVGHCFGEVTQ